MLGKVTLQATPEAAGFDTQNDDGARRAKTVAVGMLPIPAHSTTTAQRAQPIVLDQIAAVKSWEEGSTKPLTYIGVKRR